MKYRKLRFLSVVCVASLLIPQGAIAAYSAGDGDPDTTSGYTQTEPKPITINDLSISVEEKQYDGNTNANVTITITPEDPDLLNGKDVTVQWTTATFDNKNTGKNKVVTISGLYLDGEDKDEFNLNIDGYLQVSTGVITERVIELIPNEDQPHYTTDNYPKIVPFTYDSNMIIDKGVKEEIQKNSIYIVFNGKYYYSLTNEEVNTEKVLTNNTNYKIQISSNSKLDVLVPDAPELNDAVLTPANGNVNILFYDELGFIANGKVNVKVSAQSKYNESLTYYIQSDENGYKEETLSDTSFSLDTFGDKDYRKVDIKCAVQGKANSGYSLLKYSFDNKSSENLIIDKEEPSEKNDNNLKLAADNKNQQICLSGTVCDEGSGIASISYNWERDKENREGQISDFKKGTKELNINSIPLFTYSELPDEKEVTITITDLAGNIKKFTLSCEDVGVEFAKPVIKSITLKNGEETELDKFLNILSFGIYSKNKDLTLEIKAAPAEFDIEKKNVVVSLLCKNDEGNTVIFNNQTKTAEEEVVLTFTIGDEAVADQLSVMIKNEYGSEEITTLREALKSIHSNGDTPQWGDSTPDTDNSDKWVFDHSKPELKIDLDEAYDNRYYIDSTTEIINITVTDNLSGIRNIHVYNQSTLDYIISDGNGKEVLLSDENGINYTVSSIDENSITIVDTDGNEDKIALQKVDSSPGENVTEYEISTRNKYFITNSENFVLTGIRTKIEGFDLIAKDESDVKHYYPIKSKGMEIDPDEEIVFKDDTTVLFKVPVDNLISGNNNLFVTAEDNAGNTETVVFDVYLVEDTPEGELSLVVPKTAKIDGEEWILEKEILDYIEEQSNFDKPKASVKLSLKNDTNGINYIDVTVNGISVYNKSNTHFSHDLSDDIESSNGILIIELDNNTLSKLINTSDYKNNNVIQLHATMKTSISNSLSQEMDSEVYVDKENPQIGTFKISKTNDSIQDVIHILTFGIFCNNGVKVSTDVTDAANDVGVESVRFYDLNGNEFTDVKQDEQNSNSYYIILPGNAQVYQTGIKVVAIDKLGNTSTQSLDTSNVKAEDGNLEANLILIEKYAPVSIINMPAPTFDLNGDNWFNSADQNISLIVTDTLFGANNNSGIRAISVTVNEKPIGTAKSGSYKKITADGEDTEESNKLITDSVSTQSKIIEAEYTFSIYDLIEIADANDGNYEFSVQAVDNAGNVSTESVTFYRDITSPTVTDFRFSNPLQSENEKEKTEPGEMNGITIDQDKNIVKTDYGYYFKESFDLTVYAEDNNASSGLASVTLTLVDYTDGNAVRRESETKNCTYDTEGNVIFPSFTIESGFKGMILAEITDNTGNVSKEQSPRGFVSDNECPEIEISKVNQPLQGVSGNDNEDLYTNDAEFTVTITDTKSGLKSINFETNSETHNYDSVRGKLEAEDLDNYYTDAANRRYNIVEGSDYPEIGETGWKVTKTDLNVVTQIQKTFKYGDIVDTVNQYQDGNVHYFDDKNIVLTFDVFDNSNNNTTKSTTPFTIDRANPEINKISLNSFDGTKEVVFTDNNEFEYRYFYKGPFSVTAQVSDPSPSSGLNKMDYRFVTYNADGEVTNDDASVKDIKINSGKTENVQIPDTFTKGQIFVKAYDNTLENISEEKGIYGVVIDYAAPIITIYQLPSTNEKNNAVDDDGNILYNDPKKVSFRVTIEDTESGIKNIHYLKSSEKTVGLAETETLVDVSNPAYIIDSTIGNSENASDWTIEAMDHNLVTKVSRVFTFNEDDKNIQFSFKATDQSGNTSNEETSQSFTIDTAAPSVTDISFSIKTADNISGVKPEEFIEKLEYGYYFKEQMVINASCEDSRPSSGLKMMSFRFVPYRDGEQIEQSEYAEPKKSDVNDFVVSKKVVNGKAACIVEKGFKGQIFITAYDYAAFYYDINTSEEITTQAFVIEDNAPEIKIAELPETALVDDLGNKLYTGKVSFKVTITDTEAGLREVTYVHRSDNIKEINSSEKTISQVIENVSEDYNVGYTFSDTGWTIDKMDNNLITQISQTFVFDEDDKNIYMIFRATDRSNNKTADKNSEKFTIDTVNPTVEKFTFEPASEDNIFEVTDFIEELEYGYYFKKSFNAVVTVDDKIPSSGLDKIVFRLVAYENGEMVSEQSYSVPVQSKKATYLIPEGFKGQVYAQVFDRAVNRSFEETPQAFVVDEIVPIITIEPLPDNKNKTDMDGNKLYAESVQFRVTITDDKSGLRSVSYTKNSEKDSYNDIVTQIENVTGYDVGDSIGDGWQITKMDRNLITEVSQVFSFTSDDNHIIMNYRATDRSMNTCDVKKSESFTIDTTAPVIRVSCPEPINGKYYKGSVTFNFNITERNFDSSLMERTIKDSFRSNNDLQISYRSSSNTEHTATVTFPEGDYQFTYRGEDRGGNKAQIYYNSNADAVSVFSDSFNVDATAPQFTTNFNDFIVDGKDEYYFNTDKTVELTVIEHNFYAYDMGVTLQKKASGSGHTSDGDGWYEIGGYSGDWKQDDSNPDRHTLSIPIKDDAIYRVIVKPTDRAGNDAATIQSSIFEIDKTAPHLASRNGVSSNTEGFVVSPFIDVYDEKREDDPAPSLKFDDSNFDRLVIMATVYKPNYINDNQIISIDKDAVSNELSKTIYDKDFSLDKYFVDDGVYVFSFVAYDKAGNSCREVNDTYFRMVSTDILAYIANSNLNDRSGYYSLMDENQRAISKKASDFTDLDIRIITKSEDKDSYDIIIRDEKNQYSTKEYATLSDENISKTSVIKTIHLPGAYFSETFKDDSLDTRMYLSVYYKDTPYDLATIHIDNEKPSATLPDYFHSWSNVMFTDKVEVTLTGVSEKLDISKTKIYECPREGDRVEIQLNDANYDESRKTLTFTLSKGIHHIDISLVDEAGNEWNVDRIRYFTVGNLWLYVGIGHLLGITAIAITIVLIKKNKRSKRNVTQAS